jgi:biopolymer transport protein ExbD
MVDLAFLLITFFMLTTTLSKPQSMNLGLPDKQDDPTEKPIKVDENRTMTILLGDNDKLVRYVGLLATPVSGGAPKDFAYGKEGIRKELLARKASVLAYSTAKGKPKNGMIVIIKPGKKSNYRNLVDILDEMAIVDVPTYAIVNDFSPEEKKLLEGK